MDESKEPEGLPALVDSVTSEKPSSLSPPKFSRNQRQKSLNVRSSTENMLETINQLAVPDMSL